MSIEDMIPGNIYIIEFFERVVEKVYCSRVIPKNEQKFGPGSYACIKFFDGNSLSRIEHTLYESIPGEYYKVTDYMGIQNIL